MNTGNNFNIPLWSPEFMAAMQAAKQRDENKLRDRRAQWEQIASHMKSLGDRYAAEREAERARKAQEQEAYKNRQFQGEQNALNREWQSGENDLQRALQDKIHTENLEAQKENLKTQRELEQAKRNSRARGDFAALEDKYKKAYLAAKTAKDKEDVLEAGRAELRKINGMYDTELEPIFKFESNEEIMKVPEPFDIKTGDWSTRTYGELEKDVDAWKKEIDAMGKGPEKAEEMKLWNEMTKGRFGALYGAEDIKKAGQKPISKLPKDTPLSSSASEANEIIKKTGQSKKWNPKIGMWVVD